jgi:transcriptional regulator with PAS, ATPase and Fis domain
MLLRHRWPGNVRELEYEVVRAAVRRRRGILRVCDFSAEIAGEIDRTDFRTEGTLTERCAAFERVEIQRALREAGGNRTRAAVLLGIKRTTLLSRMRRFGLE